MITKEMTEQVWKRIYSFVPSHYAVEKLIINDNMVTIFTISSENDYENINIPYDIFFSDYSAIQWHKDEIEKEKQKILEYERTQTEIKLKYRMNMSLYAVDIYKKWLEYRDVWEGQDDFETYLKKNLKE